jgi:hypothetical protein
LYIPLEGKYKRVYDLSVYFLHDDFMPIFSLLGNWQDYISKKNSFVDNGTWVIRLSSVAWFKRVVASDYKVTTGPEIVRHATS